MGFGSVLKKVKRNGCVERKGRAIKSRNHTIKRWGK